MSPTQPNTIAPVIDCQVHAYERDRPERPWAASLVGPPEVTGDQMVAAMDAVGVGGALLVSPFRMYRYDGSYALEVRGKHPSRFGLIKPFDPNAPDIEAQVDAWAHRPGVVGARLLLTDGFGEAGTSQAGPHRLLASAAEHGLPVNVLCWGKLAQLGELAAQHANTRIVIDHLGLPQPFHPPPPRDPFADLDDVVGLAALDNVAIKISGACTLSHQPFPFDDIWAPLARILDAYGLERCMWGTDWTRAVELVTYEEAVQAFRITNQLSESERGALMGGSLARIYEWRPG